MFMKSRILEVKRKYFGSNLELPVEAFFNITVSLLSGDSFLKLVPAIMTHTKGQLQLCPSKTSTTCGSRIKAILLKLTAVLF